MESLQQKLRSLDGKGYKAYKSLEGCYSFPDYELTVDHVQGDPFAAPTRISIRIEMGEAAYPEDVRSTLVRRIALEDYLGRCIEKSIKRVCKGKRGSGKSGEISIAQYGQQVLQRNAVLISKNDVEARITLGLPAAGRQIAAEQAEIMLFEELPSVINASLYYENLPADKLSHHVDSVEDQHFLRESLAKNGLVAFVANGSRLPRYSGIDDHPLELGVIAFQSPSSLETSFELPNAGTVTGMGIPKGISLIVGGGFHGKSTLLQALEYGVYNHMPGDGREKVVTDPGAVKIRAEDGRSISNVNISPFINRLPFGRDTTNFSTKNASGSTSQAANIIEALECGAQTLLIDEDTSATNFMIRDERMQALVADEKEPITPLLHRIRELHQSYGISSVIVMGGSGDYFDVADHVIMLDAYRPVDVTEQAQHLARQSTNNNNEAMPGFETSSTRKPGAKTLDPSRNNRDVKINTWETNTLLYGEHKIDLSSVAQLVDPAQIQTIGMMIYFYSRHYFERDEADTENNLIEGLQKVLKDGEQSGLDIFNLDKAGDLAMPRIHELAAAINRVRNGDWH
jgi:predicted ABC-class ATPase